MKKVVAVLLAFVFLFSLTGCAFETSNSVTLTITLRGENIPGMEDLDNVDLTVKLGQVDNGIVADATVNVMDQSINAIITYIDEQLGFCFPAYSDELFVLDPALLSSMVSVTSTVNQQDLTAALMDTNIVEDATKVVMAYAGILGGFINSGNMTQSQTDYMLPGLNVTVPCSVTVIAPTEADWSNTMTNLFTMAKTDNNIKALIGDICQVIFQVGTVSGFNTPDELTAYVTSMIPQLCDQVLASVSDTAAMLGSFRLEVAIGPSGLACIKLAQGDQDLSFAMNSENGITRSAVTLAGQVFMTTEARVTADAVSGQLVSEPVGLQAGYNFSKTQVSELDIPYGEASFSIPGVAAKVSVGPEGAGTAHAFALSAEDGTLTLKAVSTASSEKLSAPQGKQTVITTQEELQDVLTAVANVLGDTPVVTEPAPAPAEPTTAPSSGSKLGGKLKGKVTNSSKATDENGKFVVTCDEYKALLINAIQNDLGSSFVSQNAVNGLHVEEINGYYYLCTDAWNDELFEIYFYTDEEVSGDSNFTDACLMFYNDNVFGDEGLDYLLDYMASMIYISSPSVTSYEEAYSLISDMLDYSVEKEDGTGMYAGITDDILNYYFEADWFEDGAANYYFSVFENVA